MVYISQCLRNPNQDHKAEVITLMKKNRFMASNFVYSICIVLELIYLNTMVFLTMLYFCLQSFDCGMKIYM